MELLRSQLSKVRIPEPSNRIYKQECCISYDTPKSDGGLYVDLCSFLAFGKDYVMWQYHKTGNSVYLNIKERPKPDSEDRPHKKPTLLAIGVDGGFNAKEPEYESTYNIVVLPDFIELPFPNVELPEKVRLAVDGVLAAVGAERKEQVAAWTAEKRPISAFAYNLQQLENGVQVPPTGWKCAKCDKVDNLWLNLTDGMILCGRRNWDGTGGNNHALEHYQETKYPLALKLGTITADLETADVYSYAEDATVEDPFLPQHLAHFGIDFSSLKKTEMTTAERELDQNVNFDWNRIQESGKDLEPLHGPGYTGLVNLGNSCYLASVMQVVFSTHRFQQRYFINHSLEHSFQCAPSDPTVDLNMQLTKLAHGLLSGKNSAPVSKVPNADSTQSSGAETEQKGISPYMFKSLIGAGHPEFSSSRQQDALEYFQFLLDQIEQCHTSNLQEDPSCSFKFVVEERICCTASGKVKYNKRAENVLSLNIPLDSAINKDEVSAFLKKKAEKEATGESVSDQEIVRPRVPLSACFEKYAASEEVPDFFSSAVNGRTTALKSSRLATFPDYLVIHMRKFVMETGWVPKKLDVYVDVPDILDISQLRSKGLQPHEELLPEETEESSNDGPTVDETVVSQLMEMGFSHARCVKAVVQTSNTGVDAAMQWIFSHMDDTDIDDPVDLPSFKKISGSSKAPVNESDVENLVSFGFPAEQARKALRQTGGDVERAAEWIFTHPDEASAMDVDNDAGASGVGIKDAALSFPDGKGEYKLLGFVSHMGTSTQCGHYVAHILKDGRWVIFNDSKVAASGDPPKDMGYLYFYQRLV